MDGWDAVHFARHSERNVVAILRQIVVLALTLFLWTFDAGYMVLLERDNRGNHDWTHRERRRANPSAPRLGA